MRLTALTLLCCSFACAGELPDAPHLKMRPLIETYSSDERMIVHNTPSVAPRTPRNLDWRFLAAHGVYAGALSFDLYLTARGVSNGCEEASSNLGPFPSNKRIVGYGLVEFGLVTTMDYFLKRTHVPGLSYVGAGIGTFKHQRGGRAWLRTDCL